MSLVKCKNCGNIIPEKAKFCPECGKPIVETIICQECGEEIPNGVDACPRCRHPFEGKEKQKDEILPEVDNYEDYPKESRKKNYAIYFVISITLIVVVFILCAISHYYSSKEEESYLGEPLDVVMAAAEKGVANAQEVLGSAYYYGKGVYKNYIEAAKWYRKAAEQGNYEAQFSLGLCYERGHGVIQDYAEAIKWYRKAAEKDYAVAQNNLGWFYANGFGTPQNYVEAVKWYTKAAYHGLIAAQNNLGWCYANGAGVAQDYEEAAKWFSKAAEKGDEKAIQYLEYCYKQGNIVPSEDKSAKGEAQSTKEGDNIPNDYIGKYAIYPKVEGHNYDIILEENNVAKLVGDYNWNTGEENTMKGVWSYNTSSKMVEVKLDEAIKIFFGTPPVEQWVRLLYIRGKTIARLPKYITNKDVKQCSTLSPYYDP